MRYLLFFLSCFALLSCEEKTKSTYSMLEDGMWRLYASEKPFNGFQQGVKFAENGQVFRLDTQGHFVPHQHKIVYEVNEDTLKIIDHKYLKKVREEKGVEKFIIKELTADTLKLTLIYPEGPNNLVFVKY